MALQDLGQVQVLGAADLELAPPVDWNIVVNDRVLVAGRLQTHHDPLFLLQHVLKVKIFGSIKGKQRRPKLICSQ